jgi:hypothetical protein
MRDKGTGVQGPGRAIEEALTFNPSPMGRGEMDSLSLRERARVRDKAQDLSDNIRFPYFRKKDKMIIMAKNVPASVPMRFRSLITSE